MTIGERMSMTYTHELNKEVLSISGWYELEKEERITHQGREILYVVGNAVVDSSCCGSGGCRYAVVPGYVLSWKSGTNENGLSTSQVEPVRAPEVQSEIRDLLEGREGVTQVQFW
jgi:hypothetical protein